MQGQGVTALLMQFRFAAAFFSSAFRIKIIIHFFGPFTAFERILLAVLYRCCSARLHVCVCASVSCKL